MTTQEALFKATSLALKQEKIDFEIRDESGFFKLMLSSGLSGLIIPYLDTNRYSKTFIQKTNSTLYSFIHQDQKQQVLIAQIKTIFQQQRIDHIFLKGTKMKGFYPDTYMRGMGDIDILVRSDLDVIKNHFKSLGINLESRTLQHDQYITSDQLLIEIHPSIHKDFNPKYQTYFKTAWDHTIPVTGCEYTLKPTFEVIYLVYHLAKHVESSGIGLRSLLDIAIYIEKNMPNIDVVALNQTLADLKMTKFFQTILYLNHHYFGSEVPLLDSSFNMREDLLTQVTSYFLTSGIHGKGSDFNAMAPRLAASENKGKSKFKVLLRIAFPKMVDARGMYPVLNKHPYLYPLMMFHRIIKLIFFKRQSSLKKIRNLNESNSKRSEIEQLFEDIGIY
jgi:hypothetical protein